ncbi:MAG: GlsB/YeaQ/YmgE family stress response membrane protein [Actinomycetota bacterium]
MRELIRFLLVGFVSGWIASIVVRGRTRLRGCLSYLVIGTVGALIGGYLLRTLGMHEVAQVVSATVGAIVLLVLIGIVRNA